MTHNKLIAEYESLRQTDFWRVYHERIGEYLETERSKCEDSEEVARSQGAVRAYRTILGRGDKQLSLAERILNETSNNKGEH